MEAVDLIGKSLNERDFEFWSHRNPEIMAYIELKPNMLVQRKYESALINMIEIIERDH